MYKNIILHAFRTSLIIVLTFVIYELDLDILDYFKNNYNDFYMHNSFILKNLIKFLIVFILDVIILYTYVYIFKIKV